MAMAELARHEPSKSLPLPQISEAQRLPLPYLEQLFLALRRSGLVESVRGRSGGYRLSRAAADITISDVMAAVEEDTHFTRCNEETAGGCHAGERCITHGLWKGLSEATAGYLSAVTLADVVTGELPARKTHEVPAVATASTAQRIYLDYNATAPMLPEAKVAMIAAFEVAGNPSSVHAEGRKARGVIETAREQVAALVGALLRRRPMTGMACSSRRWG